MADNDAATPPASATMPGLQLATVPAPSARARGVAPGLAAAQDGTPSTTQSSVPAVNGETAPAAAPATFHAEEKWSLAGYNNNEPIYTILVTSHDARIIRCTADLKGTYIENGEKLSIADRQTTTVFPNQQVQIGNWSGMDQQSGATYSVKCRPI
jgi:hypothetical protein